MKKLARNTLALGTATMIVTAGLSFSANGADATKSYSAGRFLTGSIGGTNLDALAQLRGVNATNPGNPGANKNPLDLTVLSALPINIPGGLNLNLANFLSPSGNAGAIAQYAAAPSTNQATGASGLVNDQGAVLAPNSSTPPANARVTLLNGPLGAANNLADVNLLVGALSSSTTAKSGSPSRDYQIAGLGLDLRVPVLGTLIGGLTTAGNPLGAPNVDDITVSLASVCTAVSGTLNVTTTALLATLRQLNLGAIADLLDAVLNPPAPLPAIGSLNLCDTASLGTTIPGLDTALDELVSVQVKGLGGLLDGLKDVSGDGITVDLTGADAGRITIDLEKILAAAGTNLNDLPPNADILSFLTSNLVSGKIKALVDSVTANIAAKVADVDLEVTVVNQKIPLTLGQLTDPVSSGLVTLLNGVSTALTAIGSGLDPALAQLVPNLQQLVKLTGNNQSTSKTPTLGTGTVNAGTNVSAAAVGDYFRTSALKINALGGQLNVDLAASEAATLPADAVADGGAAAAADDADDPDADSVSDGNDSDGADSDGAAGAGDSDTIADADAQADADVTTALPATGAPNLLPFWLLGIALLLFGGAVLVNEKRRLNAAI
jgi:hypothetical protein